MVIALPEAPPLVDAMTVPARVARTGTPHWLPMPMPPWNLRVLVIGWMRYPTGLVGDPLVPTGCSQAGAT